MNIFVLDEDVKKCAEYHCNVHSYKMVVEYAQLLSSVYYFTKDKDNITPIYNMEGLLLKNKIIVDSKEFQIYQLTHKNHPCAVWVRESLSNWMWLKKLGVALYQEYKHRYKKDIHLSGEIIENLQMPSLVDIGLTKHVQCFDLQYKELDPIQGYRNYYIKEKQHLLKYKNREVPAWLLD